MDPLYQYSGGGNGWTVDLAIFGDGAKVQLIGRLTGQTLPRKSSDLETIPIMRSLDVPDLTADTLEQLLAKAQEAITVQCGAPIQLTLM